MFLLMMSPVQTAVELLLLLLLMGPPLVKAIESLMILFVVIYPSRREWS